MKKQTKISSQLDRIIDLKYLNSLEEMLKNIEDIGRLHQLEIHEVLERKVSELGNSAHISMPRKHLGKTAKVIILKRLNEEYKC